MSLKAGIILGSGLNKFAEELSSSTLIHEDSDSFHNVKIISGKIGQDEVVLFSGRKHFYEGLTPDMVLQNVNIARDLGIKTLIVTNAAGGLNKNFNVSDLMLITSHLNLSNKKIPVAPSRTLYNFEDMQKIRKIAHEEKISLRCGSYCCAQGPMYETKSEIRFLSRLGIDAVGMSTVPEILYANSLGIKTIAFSCITNIVSENSSGITTHEEVIDAGMNSYSNFSLLLKKIISKFDFII